MVQAIDKGDMVGVIFIDFHKAFDLVVHDILLKKMSSYKINQRSLDWFCSYLSNRTHKRFLLIMKCQVKGI